MDHLYQFMYITSKKVKKEGEEERKQCQTMTAPLQMVNTENPSWLRDQVLLMRKSLEMTNNGGLG